MKKSACFTSEDKEICLRLLNKLKRLCRLWGKDILLMERAYATAYGKHYGVRRKHGSP